jgi:hypothetical protein
LKALTAPETTAGKLENVRDYVADLKQHIEYWQEFRDSIPYRVLDIIEAAAPELEEDPPYDPPHRSTAELPRPGLPPVSHHSPGEGGYRVN